MELQTRSVCREITFQNPSKFKIARRDKRQYWDSVTEISNDAEQQTFSVDQRGVRERYFKLEKNFKIKMALEERASGITGEDLTELGFGSGKREHSGLEWSS